MTVLENVYSGLLENADTDAKQRTPDNPRRTTDAGQPTPDNGRRTNDGKDGQTMEKTDKRWKRRTTIEKTDNDGKDGKRWKRRTTMDGQRSNVGLCHIYC